MIPFEEASEWRSGLPRTEHAICQLDFETACHRGVVWGRMVKERKVNNNPHKILEERYPILLTEMPNAALKFPFVAGCAEKSSSGADQTAGAPVPNRPRT